MPKAYVIVRGGMVQSVYSDIDKLDIIVVDYDIEEGEELDMVVDELDKVIANKSVSMVY